MALACEGEALDALCNAGHRLCVVTSKPTHYARVIVDHFELAQRFDDIVGAELDGGRADKAELVIDSPEDLMARFP